MKIVQLTASNLKRLKAVDITPSDTVQIVGGRNAQGKTSVLDAIWLALGGGTAAKGTARPIRDGEDAARVVLDLGELVVTRTWTGSKSTLTVASPAERSTRAPQRILDALLGRLSFDPLAFTRLSAKDQRDALLGLVDLPFDPAELDRQRAAIFDERTEIGRRGASLKGHLDGLPVVEALDEEVSSSAILADLRAAQDVNQGINAVIEALELAQSAREQAKEAFEAARARLATATWQETGAALAVKNAPERVDLSEIEHRLAAVDETNAAVRAKRERARVAAEYDAARTEYEAKSSELAVLDQEKADGLAKAVFPIVGLGFDEAGVTYSGVPFSQASSAEQIRVSLAMAMSLNPKLRVIRIVDGSLLDEDSLALITDMAREHDYQVWIERVGDADEAAIIIEDGEVRA